MRATNQLDKIIALLANRQNKNSPDTSGNHHTSHTRKTDLTRKEALIHICAIEKWLKTHEQINYLSHTRK